MAISYPLSLPSHTGIQSITFRMVNTVGISQSPFTYAQQAVAHAGQRWEVDVTLPPMKRADAEQWVAWLASLRGQLGTFTLGDPIGTTPRGSAATTAGTPVVNGASQTGNELAIDGLPTSATGYLKAGDYIQLGTGTGSQLYKVLDDVDTNASGEATLTIWPDLRSSPADGATVVVSDAVGLFRISTSTTDWNVNNSGFYSMTFGAVEAL